MSYEAFLNVVYNKNDSDLMNLQGIQMLNARDFMGFLQNWHNKAYIDQIKKMQMICEYLQKHNADILFLDEAETR